MRRVCSGAWRDRTRLTFRPSSARAYIFSTTPTVDTVIRRCDRARALGSMNRRIAAMTAS